MIYFSTEKIKEAYDPKLSAELKRLQKASAARAVAENHSEHEDSHFQEQLKHYEEMEQATQPLNKGRIRSTVAEEIMSKTLEMIAPQVTVGEALSKMQSRGFQHYPVVDGGSAVVGIVSERDLLKARADQKIQEVMTRRVLTTDIHSSLRDMALAMLNEKIGALPVTNADGKIVGIITRTDILRALVAKAPLNLWA